MSTNPRYKRVVLKVSGESLCPPGGFGIDIQCLTALADEIAAISKLGVQIGLVVGAGNLIRGRDFNSPQAKKTVHRTTADYMGMLATIANALAMHDALEARKVDSQVLSAFAVTSIAEAYMRRKAVGYLEQGSVVIFAGGTGSPFFTTDMCAALRASEIDADIVLKATKVDGVYDSDPVKNPGAHRYDRLSYQKVIEDRLGVMDLTAITMCMESKIPILVFELRKPGSLAAALCGEKVGTLIAE